MARHADRPVSATNPLPITNTGQADVVPGSSVVTEIDHYLLHIGNAFVHKDVHTVLTGADLDYLLVNNSAYEVHLISWGFESTAGDADILVYKGTTTSADGSAETMHNRNNNSVKTSSAVLTEGPTVTTVGTEIEHTMISAAKHSAGSTKAAAEEEIILKVGEKMLFRFTNNAVGSDTVSTLFHTLDVNRPA